MNSDLTSVLHITDSRGRALLIFYGSGTAFIAVLNIMQLVHPWQGIVALVLVLGALTMLGWRGRTPYGLLSTFIVIAIVVTVALCSAWNLLDPLNPGYSGWYLGACTFVLLVLGLRGRRALSWIGFVLLAAIALISTHWTGESPIAAISEVGRQAGTLFIGTLFGTVLRRAAIVIALIQERQLRRAASEVATAVATRERATQSARLEAYARPALERLLSDDPLTADEKAGMALLEAELRDGIRAAGFARPEIVASARAARERGVHVVLADDRGVAVDEADMKRVESTVIAELDATVEGSLMARLSPLDSDEIATIVIAEGDDYRRIVITGVSIEITTLTPDDEEEAESLEVPRER